MRAGAILAATLVIAWALTWWCRRRALRLGLMDVPGARSSHAVATPTGGGVGIVGGWLAALGLALLTGGVGADWLLVFALACVLAVLGFCDDRRALPALPRLVCQCAAAAAVTASVLPGPALAAPLGAALLAALAVLLVWMNNAFNFMDGIDGLAAAQAVFMAGAAALLLALEPDAADSSLLLGAIGAAALGFLLLNWPPARIFMGDAGSQPLGFLLAAAPLVTAARGELSWSVWLILWAVFLADASLTLLHRAWRRAPLLQSHRDHAYQRLARRWGAHRPVTLACIAVNLLWLLPLALLAHRLPPLGPALVLLAYLPVCAAVAVTLRRQPLQA